MTYLDADEANKLLDAAKRAAEKTYSPYSHFVVGAALLAMDGQIYSGSNIENASYGLTVCAERIAIGNALTDGNNKFSAIAVYGNVDSISPCGACRQFIIEFGTDIMVIFRQDGHIVQRHISELLPYQFKMPG